MLIPFLYYILPKGVAILALALFALLFIVIDYVRLHVGSVRKLFMLLFGQLLRRRELYTLTGGSYLLLACLVAIIVFPDRGIFIASILFLTIGDTVAALFGLRFGRSKFFRKSIEGTLACLASCVIVAYFVSILPNASLPLKIGLIGAVIATIVEALPVEVNDNVVIPIFAGAVMQIVKSLV